MKHVSAKPDIILFSSMYHGGIVQNYWAYSSQVFFVSSIGGRSLSGILNPLGETIASTKNYYDYVVSKINLDYVVVHLDNHIGKLRTLKN